MSEWHEKTKAQLFYAQKALEACVGFDSKGDKPLEFKAANNALILAMREAWLCWLNELSSLLAPKQKMESIRTFRELCQHFGGDIPEIEVLSKDLSSAESWVSGYVELEQGIGLSVDQSVALAAGPAVSASFDALALKQVEMRALSYKHGIEDLGQMLIALKLYINEVRSRQVEW